MGELVARILSYYDETGPFVLHVRLSRKKVRKPREVFLRIPIDRREVDLLDKGEIPNQEFDYLERKLRGGKWDLSTKVS